MKVRSLVLVLVFMLLGIASVSAVQIQGEVTNVDTDTPALTVVDTNGSMVTIVVTDKTDVQKGFKDIKIASLTSGSMVVLRYDVKAGKNIARYVGLVKSGEKVEKTKKTSGCSTVK